MGLEGGTTLAPGGKPKRAPPLTAQPDPRAQKRTRAKHTHAHPPPNGQATVPKARAAQRKEPPKKAPTGQATQITTKAQDRRPQLGQRPTNEQGPHMRTRSKLLLGTLTAAIVLAALVNTATARRLEISNTGIRHVWTNLEFTGFGGLFIVRCPVTLEGTLHSRTISKVSGQLIGYITRAIVGPREQCTGGSAVILTVTLPWHINYDRFIGELPRIRGIRLQLLNAGFNITARILGAETTCLFKSTHERPAFGILELNTETGRVENLRADETEGIPRFEGAAACPSSGEFRGRATTTLLGNTTPITIRLVQ
jgi:hypothetical protein